MVWALGSSLKPTSLVSRSTAPPSWSSVRNGGRSGEAARNAAFIAFTAARLLTFGLRYIRPPSVPAAISSRIALTEASFTSSPLKPTMIIWPAIWSSVAAPAGAANDSANSARRTARITDAPRQESGVSYVLLLRRNCKRRYGALPVRVDTTFAVRTRDNSRTCNPCSDGIGTRVVDAPPRLPRALHDQLSAPLRPRFRHVQFHPGDRRRSCTGAPAAARAGSSDDSIDHLLRLRFRPRAFRSSCHCRVHLRHRRPDDALAEIDPRLLARRGEDPHQEAHPLLSPDHRQLRRRAQAARRGRSRPRARQRCRRPSRSLCRR